MAKANETAPTVGYLIGGFVQLGIGAVLILRSVFYETSGASIFGLFLVFLGVRTIVKYRARTRTRGTPSDRAG